MARPEKTDPVPPSASAVAAVDVEKDVVEVVRKYHPIVYGKTLQAEIDVETCAEEEDGFAALRACIVRSIAAGDVSAKITGAQVLATTPCGKLLEDAYREYVTTVLRMHKARIAWLDDRKSKLTPILQDQSLVEAAQARALDLDWPNDDGRMVIKDGKRLEGTPIGLNTDLSIQDGFAAVGGGAYNHADTYHFSNIECVASLPMCTGVDECSEFQIAEKINARPRDEKKDATPSDTTCTAQDLVVARTVSKELDDQPDVPERQILKQIGRRFSMPWKRVRDITKKAMWHCGVK